MNSTNKNDGKKSSEKVKGMTGVKYKVKFHVNSRDLDRQSLKQ